jgi:small-conductance mechanosensitive channel
MTPNKQRVIVPNSKLSNETMTNYSSEKTRRIDLEI